MQDAVTASIVLINGAFLLVFACLLIYKVRGINEYRDLILGSQAVPVVRDRFVALTAKQSVKAPAPAVNDVTSDA